MLSYISGTIKHKTEDSLIIMVQGLGYEVFVNSKVWKNYDVGDQVEFFIYQHVREDALLLFGFENYKALELFKRLVSISGIGPKSAMGILEIATVDEIIASIQKNDPHLLTKVSGVGKKTAERVVLELKNKVASESLDIKTHEQISASSDEIDALVALGYSTTQAREALSHVPAEIKNISDRVKEALKNLGR
jgi:Holliday junction DNA helicase RuvA